MSPVAFHRWVRRSLAVLLGAVLTGCASDGDSPALDAAAEVVVFAAASLTDALEQLASEFAAEGGASVVLNVAGSQTLATQLLEGASADVFIAADVVQMDRVVEAGLAARPPVVFATNRLAIVVEEGNPRRVTGLDDLSRSDLIVVLAAEQNPAGRYAADVLSRAGVTVRPASLERSVRAALAKVAQGEADAAIVFASDVVAALRSRTPIAGVDIPEEENLVATYPLVRIAGGRAGDGADAFITFLRSERGREVLVEHGFGAP